MTHHWPCSEPIAHVTPAQRAEDKSERARMRADIRLQRLSYNKDSDGIRVSGHSADRLIIVTSLDII